MAITGIHAILYTHDAESDRAWLAEVLGLESVDAGGGWLVFALPPAELAAHPASSRGHDVDLYLMCDDIETTMDELRHCAFYTVDEGSGSASGAGSGSAGSACDCHRRSCRRRTLPT